MPRSTTADNQETVPVVRIKALADIKKKLAKDAYIPDLKDGALREYWVMVESRLGVEGTRHHLTQQRRPLRIFAVNQR